MMAKNINTKFSDIINLSHFFILKNKYFFSKIRSRYTILRQISSS